MQAVDRRRQAPELSPEFDGVDHDLSDLLQELRILLQGVQVLTAFLIILPFNAGFERLDPFEKWVYLVTFLSSITGLVFVSAPAAQHRIQRPLLNRERFKHFATRMILVGTGAFSIALVLAAQLVSNEVVGYGPSLLVALIVAVLIATVWWLIPVWTKARGLH